MSTPSVDPATVDYSGISEQVKVHGIDDPDRNSRQAAYFIDGGCLVTDKDGYSLKIARQADGSYKVVRGEDPLGWRNEQNRHETNRRARLEGDGRPSWLGERELTDYESGRPHPMDCGIANCDHPVHFGGSETGELTFEKVVEKGGDGKDSENTGGEGSATV